jgi:5-methylthioribose kinase
MGRTIEPAAEMWIGGVNTTGWTHPVAREERSMLNSVYEALTPQTLGERLGKLDVLTECLGTDISAWSVKEVGDGNLNLVFIVESASGRVIIKQALPYVRLVGDSWPLPLSRAFFEYHALKRQALRDPGSVPEIYHFDEEQALIIMEYLNPHILLRHDLMSATKHETLAEVLGNFVARTLFRGSDLSMNAVERKQDVALFAGNDKLCDITENLIFNDPYFDAEMNRHTTPHLDGVVAELRADMDLKVEVQHLKSIFCANAETMLHGDLHTGSVMVTPSDVKVIDPEFALYGPMGFDVGMLLANFYMAYFAQPGHIADAENCKDYQAWILQVCEDIWQHFVIEFSHLWRTERTGILYPASLYEDQGHHLASEQALTQMLSKIWQDLLGFCGVEMHRRILGLAHIAELDTIEDEALRAQCETKALLFGRHLIKNRHALGAPADLSRLALVMEKETRA